MPIPQEEHCPVPDSMLGDLYRASSEGIAALVETVPPQARAMLAVYCARRSHLASVGLAVAFTCTKDELVAHADEFGAMLFEQARQPQAAAREKRRKITLSNGSYTRLIVAQDLI